MSFILEALGGWAISEALGFAKGQVPKRLDGALREALAAADGAVPEVFARCQPDSLKGIRAFLKAFFQDALVVQELRKPLEQGGKPDVEVLLRAFEQQAEGHGEAEQVARGKLRPWLDAFAEGYFQRMPDGVRFWVARADYCEQLRNAFDDVKFGGIAVEGQEIDRAEKLADIFVMPDVREEKAQFPSAPQLNRMSSREMLERAGVEIPLSKNDAFVEFKEKEDNYRFIRRQGTDYWLPDISQNQTQLITEQTQIAKWKSQQEQSIIVSAKELLKQKKRAVLLGAPGSGKTTLMSFWAVMASGAEEANAEARAEAGAGRTAVRPYGDAGMGDCGLPDDCLPILIRIRDLARHPDMGVLEFAQDFAQRELSAKALPKGFFEYWLDNGQALILLDGLDEVADEAQRRKTVEKISNFLGQYEDNPAIITSRPSGYKRDFFRTDEYPHYELQPFDDGKIDEFIDHWYDSRFELASERQRRKDSLRKALKGQPRIKRLARNPLLLTIIALIHRYQAKLPRERYKLYDKAVETLLTSWDANKELSNHETLEYLELDDLRRLMERLAYWIHSQGGTGDEEGGTLIDRDELIVQLGKYIKEMKGVERYQAKEEAKRFLELVVRDRAGLLAQQGQDRYAFVHKTFQEYLTAMEIRDRQEEGFEVVLEHVEEHLHDPHWEEVLLLLIAQQKRGNPSKVLEAILSHDTPYEKWLHRNLFFAGMCLAENVPVTKSSLAQDIIQKLVSFEISDDPKASSQFKHKIFQLLISFSDTIFAVEAIKQLSSCNEIDQWRLLFYQNELCPEKASTELLLLLENDDSRIRHQAIEFLSKLSEVPSKFLNSLLSLLKGRSLDERCSIVKQLGKIGIGSTKIINYLLLILDENDIKLRYQASKSLIRLGNTSPIVIDSLMSLWEEDDFNLSVSVIKSLESLPVISTDVANKLFESIENCKKSSYLAVQYLSKLEISSDSVKARLLALLEETDDPYMRCVVTESLVKLGETSQLVVDSLFSLLKEEDSNLRFSAAESLVAIDKYPELVVKNLILLLQDTSHEESFIVRHDAERALVEFGKKSSLVMNELLKLLKHENVDVRAGAARCIGDIGEASEDTIAELLTLLKDSSSEVISISIASLIQLGRCSDEIVRILLELIKDENPSVQSLAVQSLGKSGNTSEVVIHELLALLSDYSLIVFHSETGVMGNMAATSLTQLGKTSPNVLPTLVQWIEQNENQPYVGNGIDVLSELVN